MVWIPFQPEGLKLVLDEWAAKSRVEVRFYTRLIDADVDHDEKKVKGVITNNVEGYRYVQAKAFIDCTGDAVLSDLCGAQCREAGRDTANIMPPTLRSLHANIDWDNKTSLAHQEDAQGDPHSPWRAFQQKALTQAVEDHFFMHPDRHLAGGLVRIGQTLGYLNIGHVYKTNALKCQSLSAAMVLGRRIVREYLDFYRKFIPGCEHMELVTTGPLLGVRESRRIVGEYELTIDDYLARRQFPDQIGVFNKYVDKHPYDNSSQEHRRFHKETVDTHILGKGECFGLPYSILVPKGWQNLWVAGRCNSSDIDVHAAIRVMPAAARMGQAAGTAAVQAIRTGQIASALDTEELIVVLRANGAYLPQKTLSKTMTRGETSHQVKD